MLAYKNKSEPKQKLDRHESSNKSFRSLSRKSDQIINDTYKIGKKIGSGSYGQIRIAIHIKSGKKYAVKIEPNTIEPSQLNIENQFYQLLQNKKGFPYIHYYGTYGEYQVLVMEMLGKNLENAFDLCNRRFSLKTIIFLILQLLKRFETIHKYKIGYRDVKPENFLLGIKSNTVNIIDFGLSKLFVDPATNKHVPCLQTNEIIGTSRYMSVNAHLCKEQSRRDDLESIAYVIIYFLRQGKLPWSGLKVATFSEHNKQICEIKRNIGDEELCNGFPDEFIYYLKYVRSLEFEEEPDYEKLRNMFKRLFHNEQFKDDGIYDWNIKADG